MKKILIVAVVLLLAGCSPPESERRAQFMAQCVPAFTPPQCAVLFSLKEDVRDTKRAANAATFVSGMSLGMNAGRK